MLGLGRVVGEHDRLAAIGEQRARLVAVLPQHGRADGHHQVVTGQRLAESRPPRRQVPGEPRVALVEAGPGPERLLPHQGVPPVRQRLERCPGVGVVGSGADHEHRVRRCVDETGHCRQRLVPRVRAGEHSFGRDQGQVVGRCTPVVHRDHHQGGAATAAGPVPRPRDRGRHVAGAYRLLDRHRVVAGQAGQPAREERLGREVATVLLADHDDEGGAGDPRGRQRPDRVAQAGGGVQHDQLRATGGQRRAAGQADHGALVQPEHERDVVGQVGEQRDLGGSRVAVHGGHGAVAPDLDHGVADRPRGVRHGSSSAFAQRTNVLILNQPDHTDATGTRSRPPPLRQTRCAWRVSYRECRQPAT